MNEPASQEHHGDSGGAGGTQLKTVLGSGFAVAAGVGTVIGMGILRTPGEIAAVFYTPWAYVGLWAVIGLFVLLNISVAAELVGLSARSGGYYVLVRRAFGAYPGFVMGWVDWLSFPATIAIKSVVMAEYLVLLFPVLQSWNKPMAVAITSVFAILQMRGVILAAKIQQVGAALACLVLLAVGVALLTAEPVTGTSDLRNIIEHPSLKQYGLVLAAIVFTYDGWLSAAYFGSEIKGGGRAVALACIRGVLVVLALYVGLNAALAFSIPLDRIAGHDLALSHALDIAWGEGAGTFVVVTAVLILLSHQNSNYMTAPRALYALSMDGLGLGKATRVHAGGNPLFGVLLTWAGAVGLILLGGFEYLLNLNALFFVVLYAAVMLGVLVLRYKEPGTERPYRAWGHPWTTVLCIAGWLLISGFMAYTAPDSAWSALVMTAIAAPVYLIMARLGTRHSGKVEAQIR